MFQDVSSEGYVRNVEKLNSAEKEDSAETDVGVLARSEDTDGSGSHGGRAKLAY